MSASKKSILMIVITASILAALVTKWALGHQNHTIYGANPRDIEAMQMSRMRFAEEYRDEALQKAKELRQILAAKEKEIEESYRIQEQLKCKTSKLDNQLECCRVDLTNGADQRRSIEAESNVLKENIKKSEEMFSRFEWLISNQKTKRETQAKQIMWLNETIDITENDTLRHKDQHEPHEHIGKLKQESEHEKKEQHRNSILQNEVNCDEKKRNVKDLTVRGRERLSLPVRFFVMAAFEVLNAAFSLIG